MIHLTLEFFFALAAIGLVASFINDWRKMNEPEDWDEMEYMPL